ncbi:MAG: hypothetical protein IT190_01640 [Microbacteriaceae bacterium]|nr:hypothetical protein [Microbacteriaceae bacterium]
MTENDQQPARGHGSAKRGMVRALAMAGARGALGIAAIGIAGASIAAATLIPLPHIGVGPTSMIVSPVAANQQRICAGPVLQLGDDIGQDATTAISVGRADVTQAATSGTPVLENMDATENAANTPSQRLLLAPPPTGEEPGILAGSQSQRVDTVDITGFAASECVKPSSQSWLVGGSTLTGRTTLIALSNPSKVNATVTLTIYSENGLVVAAGTDGIVVPPGGRRVFSLAGFVPGITSPVVKVESVGGQVTATLQQSIVRTLTPGGIDVVAASTNPAPVVVIPGIVIAGQRDVTSASTLEGYDDLAGVLRVFVPGDGRTEITVSALPEDGSGPAASSTLDVQGGIVTDFPLGEFTDGTWTLTVTSDLPVVAAVRTSTVTLDGAPPAGAEPSLPAPEDVVATDFAWFVGASALASQSLVSVAAGPSPKLHLVNTATSDAVVTIDGNVGAGTTVIVSAGGAIAVPVAADVSYRVGGFDSVQISVSYQGEGALAGFVVSPPDRGSQPIKVFNQYG